MNEDDYIELNSKDYRQKAVDKIKEKMPDAPIVLVDLITESVMHAFKDGWYACKADREAPR